MDPRIQYLTSPDGTKIAYWTLGEGGTPLLMTSPMSFSNITEEWKFPAVRSWYEALAASRRVVGYDQRGCGSSQREIADFSAEAHDRDLEAVADRADTSTLDLMAFAGHCSFAIRFAATHPKRVRRLVLWSPSVRDATNEELEALDAFLALAASNWTMGSEVFSHAVLGWSRGEEAHANAAYLRATISSDDFVRLWRGARAPGAFSGVIPLLPRITAKTLVVDQPNAVRGSRDATIVASEIPNAELLRLEGGMRPHNDEHGRRAVEDFLADGHVGRPAERRADVPTGMTAILFADIADSTALTERLGDAAFRTKARDLDAALRTVISDHSGTCIDAKTLGDGVLAVFQSARQAIEAALACARSGDDAGLPLHLGLHAGDVIREENNVFGGAVNIAARISALAAPGEVLVSETIRSLARTSAGVAFEDRGERALKGIEEPVRVWAVEA